MLCLVWWLYVLSEIHQELCIFVKAREYHKALSDEPSPSGATDNQFGGGQTKPEVLETRKDGGKHYKIAVIARRK